MTNLPATLSTLDRQIGELNERLAPVTDDHVSKAIRSLLAAGLALPSGMDPDKAPDVYGFALSGVSVCGVQKATAKIIRGEYEINRAFIPTPPEFAALARKEASAVRGDLTRLQLSKESLIDARPREKTDPQQMEKIRDLTRRFKQQNPAAERRYAAKVPEQMTPEQEEYWAKIMALPSASHGGMS